MTLLADPAPRLYAIPPGVSFAPAFAAGLLRRLDGHPPEAAVRIRLIVNTSRARTEITEALADTAPGPALLPAIECIADLGADPLACLGDPQAEPALRRMLRLTRLVETFLEREGQSAPPAAAPDLAASLAELLDQLDDEGIPVDALQDATGGEFAAHWERSLGFIRQIVTEGGRRQGDPKARQRRAITGLVEAWAASSPDTPVIAAGSTGSVGSTADLLAAIAGLPQGAVVLPGFDIGIDPAIWQNLTPEHPMAPFKGMFERLGLAPGDVRPWNDGAHPLPARLRLLGQALRPAPVTDAWRAAASDLQVEADESTSGLTLIEAEHPRREAAAIALAIRATIDTPDRTVAVVTPDAALARRVTAELQRFGIQPDDSLGQPLSLSPAGVFLRLVAEVADGATDATVVALLKHPLASIGGDRQAHARAARRYEMALRRAGPRRRDGAILPSWPTNDDGKAPPKEEDLAWLEAVRAAVAPFASALQTDAPLETLAASHQAAADALSGGAVWTGEDGEAAAQRLAEIARHADAHGDGPVPDYPRLFLRLLSGLQLRPRRGERHPRVSIWGTAEARIRRADVMILAGLNDGSWPMLPGNDPWLSRPMREAVGLPPPERQVGLAAHDFIGAAAAGEVFLTRSTRVDGTPTVASRWLARLTNLLEGVEGNALAAMRRRGRYWLDLLAHTHLPDRTTPRPARPCPTPPLPARPARLSMTGVEELVRDPYAIYCRHVLRLEPLPPLGRTADARERGVLLHSLLERFVRETMDGLPDAPEQLFDRIADAVLADAPVESSQRRLWRARMARLRDAFLDKERTRRDFDEPVLLEAKARLTIETPATPFTLTGRVDRIDHCDGGGYALYDYKSGQLPSRKQIGLFALQLHLGALALAAGGIEALGPVIPEKAAYLGLDADASERYLEPPEGSDIAAVAVEARASLLRLIGAYAVESRGYLSRARLMTEGEDRDYDHLARRAEWAEAT